METYHINIQVVYAVNMLVIKVQFILQVVIMRSIIAYYTGGICGHQYRTSGTVYISDCYNIGNISSGDQEVYVVVK